MYSIPLALLVSAAAVSAAMAQPSPGPQNAATLCLDQLGGNHAPICSSQSASRIASAPDICQCRGPYRQVDAPWCAKGERPPADSAAFERARAKAAKDGSLFGDSYQGRTMCVPLGSGR